jgi:hypothetical protein
MGDVAISLINITHLMDALSKAKVISEAKPHHIDLITTFITLPPLIGFALTHAEQASLDHLAAVRLEIREQEEQPSSGVGKGQFLYTRNWRAVRGFPIEAPHGHVGAERRFEGWDQLLELIERETGQIQALPGAILHVSEPYMSHGWCLLFWEAQYTIIGINSIGCTCNASCTA